ncbi:MAG: Fic family protein [Kiritimatiellae bacterium]|nr:Fic family protein [Kiritimatiellia bacterium]
MEYMSVAEAAQKWGLTPRNVQIHCEKGNIPGVTMQGKSWQIPVDAGRPMRKPRAKGMPHSILEALKSEKRGRISGGLYHRLQIDITYNSNHIEGSRLTHEQTRWIFETQTIGNVGADVPVDDIVETANHFRAVDIIIESAGAALTEQYIKKLHAQLKGGTSDSRKAWFKVGEYKKLDNVVGEMETCPAKEVHGEMVKLLAWWKNAEKTLENLLDLHVRFEQIHPFQDGNGRVGRLILLKECLKYGITPFVIAENFKQFYYLGLKDWRQGRRARLMDTCRTGQDVFILGLRQFGHLKLAEKAEAEQAASEGRTVPL